MENTTIFTPKNAKKRRKFVCDKCDFTCFKQSDYNRHLLTNKHNTTNTTKMLPKNAQIQHKKTPDYICSCGKKYNYRGSLYNHKQKCAYKEIKNEVIELENEVIEVDPDNEVIDLDNETKVTEIDETSDKNELIMQILKQNSEVIKVLKDQSQTMQEQSKTMKEMIPKIGNNNTTNNTTNNFNLNVFLNETCKDAMNITDFLESLRVQCNEMKEIQNIGFIEVASKVLLKELSGMDITKRPIHCSDLKRETLYIKDNDVWEKESESKPNMLSMMQRMQKESYSSLDDWAKKYPGCHKPNHPQHKTWMDTWGDICELNKIKDVNKVSKRIAKQVLIDKTK
jgi:hypothetical protein